MKMALLCLSCALVCGLHAAAAEVMIPDTAAGRALNVWLEAFNSGDRTVIDAAIAKIDEFYVFPDVAKKMGMAVRAAPNAANTIQSLTAMRSPNS